MKTFMLKDILVVFRCATSADFGGREKKKLKSPLALAAQRLLKSLRNLKEKGGKEPTMGPSA